jgi:drug/metabolite transporter (DMT)-like permease
VLVLPEAPPLPWLLPLSPQALTRCCLCPSGPDALSLVYISLLGSAASYGVFFFNASRGSLTKLSSLTFLTPMFAAGAGYLVLGETLTPLQLLGATVTLGAVTLINTAPKAAAKAE